MKVIKAGAGKTWRLGVCFRQIFATATAMGVFIAGTPVGAQNFSGDARHIAMGSIGDQNMASELAGEARSYRSIVIPFGLYQVFKVRDIFNPASDAFDPVRALEYASSPLHIGLKRRPMPNGQDVVNTLLDGLRTGGGGVGAVRDLVGRIQGPEGEALARDLVAGNRAVADGLVQDLIRRYGPNARVLITDLVQRFQGPSGQALVTNLLSHRSEGKAAFVNDLINGRISRDLNAYRGFAPASDLSARGLLSPVIGKRFRVAGSETSFHAAYIGAGPYFSVGSDLNIDKQLIRLLGASVNEYLPDSGFQITNVTDTQVAAAVTVGYRAHVPAPGFTSRSSRDGIYVAANYNYLHGFRYDAANIRIRFDTDHLGLVTLQPATTPALVDYVTSSKGRGRAVDLAAAAVLDNLEFTFEAKGLGNRMDWNALEAQEFKLTSLFDGMDFIQSPLQARSGVKRVELPVRYSGGASYNADRWSVETEFSRGLQRKEIHVGGEFRLGLIELRAGERYSRERWFPSAGIGLNLTKGFGIDLAAFRSATNIERKSETSVAMSLRFNR